MEPTRWQRIAELYHAAQTRPANERAAFLAEACADDADLRRQVETLLDTPATADSLFAGPAAAITASVVSDGKAAVLSGRQLGVYRLSKRIGIGGMGEKLCR
jgi:hypothetical protein